MSLKVVINNLIRNFGYQFIKVANLNKLDIKKEKTKTNDRFSLNSGERQIAKEVTGIRRDHVVRYELVGNFLKDEFGNVSSLFGGDIFCGNGYGSNIISQKVDSYIIGFDASKEAVDLANNYYSNSRMFFSVKIFPFELPKKIFDFIVSFETIEHLVDDEKLIEEFTISLKKGGYLFLSAPNEDICSFQKNNYEFHIKHYTFSEIFNMVTKRNDFELINWYGNGAFNFNDGINIGAREQKFMDLKEREMDSHLLYVFKKV